MKDENSPEAKQLFHGAQSYEEASLRLNKMASTSPTTLALLFRPVITCGTFSLELYFKCLITLEGNKYSHIHRFSKLYNQLTSESRNSICEMLYKKNQGTAKLIEAIHPHESTDGAFLQESKRPITITTLTEDAFVSYLKDIDNAFIQWRYMTVQKGQGIQIDILHTIMEAVRLVIKAKCPTI